MTTRPTIKTTKTIQKNEIYEIIKNKRTIGAVVGGDSVSGRGVAITHHQDIADSVIAGTEGILEDAARAEDDLRIVTRGLASGATIEVPLGEVLDRLALKLKNEKKREACVSASKNDHFHSLTKKRYLHFYIPLPWGECESWIGCHPQHQSRRIRQG